MITLVLGGARSGKSAVAERLIAAGADPVTYVATARVHDADMEARVAAHRFRRPAEWTTVECGNDLAGAVDALEPDSAVLIDSITTWVAAAPGFGVDVDRLCHSLRRRPADTVVVSDEVGMGVHPSTETGRRFRDALGLVNQTVAATADQVLLVVAGRVIRLETV